MSAPEITDEMERAFDRARSGHCDRQGGDDCCTLAGLAALAPLIAAKEDADIRARALTQAEEQVRVTWDEYERAVVSYAEARDELVQWGAAAGPAARVADAERRLAEAALVIAAAVFAGLLYEVEETPARSET